MCPPTSAEPAVGAPPGRDGLRSCAAPRAPLSGDAAMVLVGLEAVPGVGDLTGLDEGDQAVQRARPALLAHVEALALRRQAVVAEVERRSAWRCPPPRTTMVVPAHSGVRCASSTDQSTLPGLGRLHAHGRACGCRTVRPPRGCPRGRPSPWPVPTTTRSPPVVRRAASTVGGRRGERPGALKSEPVAASGLACVRMAVRSVAVVMAGIPSLVIHNDLLVQVFTCEWRNVNPPSRTALPGRGVEAKRFRPRRSERYVVMRWPRTLLPASSSGGE